MSQEPTVTAVPVPDQPEQSPFPVVPASMFSPEGIEIPVSTATQFVNLRARGYTVEAPAEVLVPGGEGVAFDPAEHTVPEVLAYIEAHPEQGPAIIAAELTGQHRKGIVGDQAEDQPQG